MLVRSTHPKSGLMATQETYITADGKKSPHEPARRTARGVHNWRRYGLVRFGHQTADHAFICEGTEDGLSVRMAGGELVLVTWELVPSEKRSCRRMSRRSRSCATRNGAAIRQIKPSGEASSVSSDMVTGFT